MPSLVLNLPCLNCESDNVYQNNRLIDITITDCRIKLIASFIICRDCKFQLMDEDSKNIIAGHLAECSRSKYD